MRWKNVTLAGALMVLALGLAACDGTENNRTQPTAAAGEVSPAMRGPEVPKEGGTGGETQPGEAAPTAAAK